MDPLNPVLYGRLSRLVPGGVRFISKPGESALVRVINPLRHPNHSYTRRLAGGEEYVVLCPFCDDRSGHLYVNHRYGAYDDLTETYGEDLVICFRRDCLQNPENRKKFAELVFSNFLADRRQVIQVRAEEAPMHDPGQLQVVEPPGHILPLTKLPPTHPVSSYLLGRGFDPVELWQKWQIGVCVQANDPMVEGRIYIPIQMNGALVGWQSRWPADIDWKARRIPKYYNLRNMPKRLMLYNYDLAKKCPMVVLCEGVSDVWRVGPSGVALLGKTLSPQQIDLVTKTWGKRVIIILLDSNDPDAIKKADRIYDTLLPIGTGGLLNVRLPEGLDPGSSSYELIWKTIADEAKRQDIDWPPASEVDDLEGVKDAAI